MENVATKNSIFSGSKLFGLILGALVPVIFSFFPTPEPLQPKAWLSLGLLVGAVIWIIFKALRDYQAMIVMCCLLIITKCIDFGMAFAPFGQSSWWMMFGALGIGVAAVECGFMKRVAYLMLKAFPASFRGQCLAYIFSGAIISPIMPSSTAKGVIMAPLAKNTSDALGLKPHSKGAQGIFITMFTGYVSLALTFLSGSAVNVSIVGGLPEDQRVGWLQWFITLAPWGVISTVLMILIIFKFFAPGKDEGGRVSKEHVRAELDKMGPWTTKEKITLTVLILSLACWIFEKQIGVNSTLVAVLAFIVLFAAGVAPAEKLKNVGWEALFFVGAFLCLPTVFREVGINAFISAALGDKVAPIMSNMYLLIPFICILTYVIRLFFVSLSGTAILVTAIFIPFCAQYNIHPFVIACISYMSTNTWNVNYQNTVTVAALAANGPEWLTNNDIFKGSLWYMLVNFVALMLCVPYWKLLGMC
ncbi:putative malate transporter YflS [Clostridia bacterium]|nr:putative malate transporter YflS [Clostridia bacterium]